MKKLFVAVLMMGSLSIMSCDKICVCYQPVNGVMTMSDVVTSYETRCASLTTGNRICVEESERVDPDKIAIDYKK